MIISASRRTDIPAHYSDWFFNRLREGYALVRNPVNIRQVSNVSLHPEDVDGFVFWSKNPDPMMERLNLLKGYPFYFQFTLTPYGSDVEPSLPKKEAVIQTFLKLSQQIGPARVVWRYDPILFNEKYSLAFHQEAFSHLAKQLHKSTGRCVISFLDLYSSIRSGLKTISARPPSLEEKLLLAESFSKTAKEWGITLSTCAEAIDLSSCSIGHSSCIDPDIIEQITGMTVIRRKDKNQRQECGCLESADIGSYNTCFSGCLYCYANASPPHLAIRTKQYDPASPLLCTSLTDADRITGRPVKSLLERQISFFTDYPNGPAEK